MTGENGSTGTNYRDKATKKIDFVLAIWKGLPPTVHLTVHFLGKEDEMSESGSR